MTKPLAFTTRFNWSETAIARLRELVSDGYTATQIAAAIDAPTRNVVIGKANRLGLTFDSGRTPKAAVRLCSVELRAAPKRTPKPHPPKKAVPMPQVEPPPFDPPLGGVRLMDAVAGQCRWPLGDPRDDAFRFCGSEADGVYCAHHHGIAYQPREKRVNARPTYRALSHREVMARAAS